MVRDNIIKARQRIAFACSKVKRAPEEICLVAVSKNRAVEQIEEAVACGITDIGESRIQEAVLKFGLLRSKAHGQKSIKWHMIGHLQTNKVKDAVRIFDLIHSVDSLRLAREVDKQAAKINKIQDVLVEIKTSPEETKAGIKPEEAAVLVKEIISLKNISLKGFMTIAAAGDDPEKARFYFRQLRQLRDEINDMELGACDLQLLSMGMTDDFEVAIEEGSNMVRLGRAIFEGEG